MINMQTMKMSVRLEKTIRATEVSMAMYCKTGCNTSWREVGVARAGSTEEGCSKLSYVRWCRWASTYHKNQANASLLHQYLGHWLYERKLNDYWVRVKLMSNRRDRHWLWLPWVSIRMLCLLFEFMFTVPMLVWTHVLGQVVQVVQWTGWLHSWVVCSESFCMRGLIDKAPFRRLFGFKMKEYGEVVEESGECLD